MLKLNLRSVLSILSWSRPGISNLVLKIPGIWCIGTSRSIVKSDIIYLPKDWSLKSIAYSNSIHCRSCYLGFYNGRHYFAKGTGWIHSNGWEPEHGNAGILTKRAADWEVKILTLIRTTKIKIVRPELVRTFLEIPKTIASSLRLANEVMDLDGTPANPSMYVYSSIARWRLADLFFIPKAKLVKSIFKNISPEEWLKNILQSLGKSCAILHFNGGHDYSLSTHNVFTDGTRVDFEHVFYKGLKHHIEVFNNDIETWQKKEIDGLRNIAWEMADLIDSRCSPQAITSYWKIEYEKTLSRLKRFSK